MVQQAEHSLCGALHALADGGRTFTLGVAHRELLLDRMPLSNGGAVARELAERLHRRGVGAITFQAGASLASVQQALAWLVNDPTSPANSPVAGDASTEPASRSADEPPDTPGIVIAQVAYERLSLSDDDADAEHEIAALWRTLAAAAFDVDTVQLDRRASPHDADDPEDGRTAGTTDARDPDPSVDERLADASVDEVALAIAGRAHQPKYARRLGLVMQTIARQLTVASPAARHELGERLHAVLQRLGHSPLAAVLSAAGGGRQQRAFVNAMIEVLPVSAVVDWLEVTARATDQELSHHLLRILSKLSAHAGDRRAATDTSRSFRETAQMLVSGWELDDPNPVEHGALLTHIAEGGVVVPRHMVSPSPDSLVLAAPAGETANAAAPDPDALRLVQMACEIDVAGVDALAAARTLMEDGQAVVLFDCLAQAPGATAVAALRDAATEPAAILRTLLHEPFDVAAARVLLAAVPLHSAPVLLDALEQARDRSARRLLIDSVRERGPQLLPTLLARLRGDSPWYFARNLLSLTRELIALPGGTAVAASVHVTVLPLLGHSQEQVRIEALRLLLELPDSRDAAILVALNDDSPRLVAGAIDAAVARATSAELSGRPSLSREAAVRLMRVIDARTHHADLLGRAVRALAGAPGPTVRDWLVSHVSRRSRLLRRRSLADVRPSVLSALALLATQYERDPIVRPILELAHRKRDGRRTAVGAAFPKASE